MAPEDVISVEGRAHLIHKPENFKTGKGLVVIDKVMIDSSAYSVHLIFEGRKLTQVNVSSVEEKNDILNTDCFRSLDSLLTQKYGSPVYREKNINAIWNVRSTSIELVYLYTPGIYSQIIVKYTPLSETVSKTSDRIRGSGKGNTSPHTKTCGTL